MTPDDYAPSSLASVRDQVTLYEQTDGQQGNTLEGRPIVILTSHGAISGRARKTPLMRIEQDGVYCVVASAAGAPQDPAWYHNVLAHPIIEIQDGAQHHHLVAREVFTIEKDRWWVVAEAHWPHFPEFRARAGRDFPIVVFEPATT